MSVIILQELLEIPQPFSHSFIPMDFFKPNAQTLVFGKPRSVML